MQMPHGSFVVEEGHAGDVEGAMGRTETGGGGREVGLLDPRTHSPFRVCCCCCLFRIVIKFLFLIEVLFLNNMTNSHSRKIR